MAVRSYGRQWRPLELRRKFLSMPDQEIVQALRACANGESEDCPFAVHSSCGCPGMSAELIDRLSAENADLRKELDGKTW